jgi:hypothetical protein
MAVDCTTCFPDDYTRARNIQVSVFPCASLPPAGYTPPIAPCPQPQPVYPRALPEGQEFGGCTPCSMGEIDQRDQCTRCGESISGVGKAAGGHGRTAHAGHPGHAAGGHAGAQPHAASPARPQGGGSPQSAQRAPQARAPAPAGGYAGRAGLAPHAARPTASSAPSGAPHTHTAEVGPAAQHFGQQNYQPMGSEISNLINSVDTSLNVGTGKCGLCGGPL